MNRQAVKRFFKETILKNERLPLLFILIFSFVNWLLLALVEKIGPPDFYRIYFLGKKLLSGNLNIEIMPPLFPLLLYPLGKLLSLFIKHTDAFIIAGKIISLAAGLGVVYVSYQFLKKITGRFALLGVLFFVISPWFLIMLAFPITDMLYLFFVTVTFYAFLDKSSPVDHKNFATTAPGEKDRSEEERKRRREEKSREGREPRPINGRTRGFAPTSRSFAFLAAISTAAGVLTRFEGVLLIISGFVNYFKLKKRYFYLLLASLPLLAGLFLFFRAFTPRFFAHFTDIILPQKSYLYMFLHPLQFLGVISNNIFFFVPASYPYAVKLLLMLALLGFFFYGVYRLYKIEKRLTFALMTYEILFLAAKGYIDTSRPDIECRRLFSGLWIFYLLGIIGVYFFLKLITKHSEGPEPKRILATEDTEGTERKRFNYLVIMVLWGFVLLIYPPSFRDAAAHTDAYGQKAGYAAAQWLNSTRLKDGAVVLSYTNNMMIEYYLENSGDDKGAKASKFTMVYFTVPMRYLPENRALYRESFFKELKNNRVDYIIFDYYIVQKPEFLGINDVRQMLMDEKENPRFFRVRQYLTYKGNIVGCVLKPLYTDHVETNY